MAVRQRKKEHEEEGIVTARRPGETGKALENNQMGRRQWNTDRRREVEEGEA